jgi:hypothetical protein
MLDGKKEDGTLVLAGPAYEENESATAVKSLGKDQKNGMQTMLGLIVLFGKSVS